MKTFTNGLLGLIALLMIYQIIDRYLEQQQLHDVYIQQKALSVDIQSLIEQNKESNAHVIEAIQAQSVQQQTSAQLLRDQISKTPATSTTELEMLKQLLAEKEKSDSLNNHNHNQSAHSGTAPSVNIPQTIAMEKTSYGDGFPVASTNFLLPPMSTHLNLAKRGGVLRQFNSTPKGLNPITEQSATVSDIHSYLNDSLSERDHEHPELWRSQLATTVNISEDFMTYTFTIRKGVYWQVPRIAFEDEKYAWLREPIELTAHDFVFFIKMIQDPEVECPSIKPYFEDMERIEALDDYTLQVQWSKKVYTSMSTSMGLGPLPRHVYTRFPDGSLIPDTQIGTTFNKHWFDEKRQAIGVGVCRLVQYDDDVRIVFERHKDYWGKGIHFDRIEQDCQTKDPTNMLTQFKNGNISLMGLQPAQYKSQVLDGKEKRFALYADNKKADLACIPFKRLSYTYIGWNAKRSLFADRRVRQAMSYLFPRERALQESYFGLGALLNSNVHPDTIYANPNLPAYNFDPDKAIELLLEAGWDDTDGDGLLDAFVDGKQQSFTFKMKYYKDSPSWTNTLLLFEEELRKVGIKMERLELEWKDLLKVYEDRDFDAVSGGWRMPFEVDFEQLWHSRFAEEPRSSNFCGFANSRADELIKAMQTEFDVQKRIAIAHEFQEIIHREQPYTFFRAAESIVTWQNQGAGKIGNVGEAYNALHIHSVSQKKTRYHIWKE